jgi:hypothetical protein
MIAGLSRLSSVLRAFDGKIRIFVCRLRMGLR